MVEINPDFICWAVARDPGLLDSDTGRPDLRRIGERVNDVLANYVRREQQEDEE